ncbi:MAG TPA: hypothetical protein PK095_18000, partial [Myxococcota bacterium]|nr:hypothetical protein [Myxococcota bacterium]
PVPGMACTTNALPERCYPGKVGAKPGDGAARPNKAPREIPDAACGVVPWGGYAGITARWTEVCLDGQVVERCLPTTRPGGARFESTLFTKVGGGCALRAP